MHIESEASQFFACYITQLKVKESFKLLLALKEHQTKIKKKNILQTGRLYSGIQPAKLTNHNMHSNLDF